MSRIRTWRTIRCEVFKVGRSTWGNNKSVRGSVWKQFQFWGWIFELRLDNKMNPKRRVVLAADSALPTFSREVPEIWEDSDGTYSDTRPKVTVCYATGTWALEHLKKLNNPNLRYRPRVVRCRMQTTPTYEMGRFFLKKKITVVSSRCLRRLAIAQNSHQAHW